MKGERVKALFRNLPVKAGAMVLATALVFGGSVWVDHTQTPVPELVTFVDTEGSISIAEDEVPLAAPKVTVSTKTQKKTKKIKMKKAAKKTYTKKGKTTKKTTTKKTSNSKSTTTTKTVTATSVTNKYKKGSNIDTQVTTVKTTVTKTVVSNQVNTETEEKTAQETTAAANATVESFTANVDARVMSAFNSLGFKITVNAGVPYSGLFDARTRTITLKQTNETVYHELGHFVAFIAGNVDQTPAFQNIFNSEKANYTASNKSYVLSSASEYFAESFKNYTQNPSELQASRPQTYAAIQSALATITEDHVAKVAGIYKSVWG